MSQRLKILRRPNGGRRGTIGRKIKEDEEEDEEVAVCGFLGGEGQCEGF